MSSCTCYHCDGLGTVSDGLDQHGDARDRQCSHCRGTGREPDDLPTEDAPKAPPAPPAPSYAERTCPHCAAANCPIRGCPTLVFCWQDRHGHVEATYA